MGSPSGYARRQFKAMGTLKMTMSPTKIQSALGLDVSKDTVTLFDTITRRTITLVNTKRALRTALKIYVDRDLAICEATGGYEDKLLAVLFELSIPAHRADGAKVKAYIRSFGNPAKTDAIDAAWLARYGLDRDTTLIRWQPTDPKQEQIEALVARRSELVEIRVQERNRLKAPRSHLIAADLKSHIRDLDKRITALEQQIDILIKTDQAMTERANTLRSVPGIGRILAPTLMAMMPELGTINRRQAASLAGCAPHPRESGKATQYRHTKGGRRQLRPALFIAALAAVRGKNKLAEAYKALVKVGKPKRLALVAVMRKIITIANARLRDIKKPIHQLT
jgi:transposase